MESRTSLRIAAFLLVCAASALAEENAPQERFSIWIDACSGEPLPYEDVLDDLATARVVYLGERHTLKRHHAIQARIVGDLAKKGLPLLLGLEQMEAPCQETLERYCRGEIDFDQLAEQTKWAERWSGYEQYREILEAARTAGIPILALNARAETIRQVARSGGLDGLDAQSRSELPAEVWLDDPAYENVLTLVMPVHKAATPERMRPMLEAQMCRDEAMAATLCSNLSSEEGSGRTAIVLCGAGHVAYGLGTPDRVRRRLPEVKDRIVLLSASGDVKLSERQKAMSRPIRITHDQLRQIGRPVADYLHVTSLRVEKRSAHPGTPPDQRQKGCECRGAD
jgi:uncharacterized iron-regulated protein